MINVSEKVLWTLEETAKKLSISRRTCWQMTKNGELPTVRIGRRLLISPKDVDQWVNRQRQAN